MHCQGSVLLCRFAAGDRIRDSGRYFRFSADSTPEGSHGANGLGVEDPRNEDATDVSHPRRGAGIYSK